MLTYVKAPIGAAAQSFGAGCRHTISGPGPTPMIDDYLRSARIVCFSMEVALRGDIPAYADDSGILAGDSAALLKSHRMMRRYATDAYLG